MKRDVMIWRCGILAVGIDACEHSLARRWAEAGLLPTLRGLLDRGAVRIMRHEPGLYSGSVWPSLLTGRSAGGHGRYNYVQLRPGSYAEQRSHPMQIAAEPFWRRLERAGLKLVLLDIPQMPAPAALNGAAVCDWGTHDPTGPMTTVPAELADELRSIVGVEPIGSCDDFPCRSPDRAELADALCARARLRTELALHLLAREAPDLSLIAYTEAHCAGHQLWAAHRRAEAAGQADNPSANPCLRVYQAIDAELARLIGAVGDETPVLLWLSHGMGDHHDATHLLDKALRRLDGARSRPSVAYLTAAALHRLHRRLPRRLRGALRGPLADFATRALASDRASRRWFQVRTNDNAAGIRINLQGREPNGRIAPGAEYDRTLTFLKQRLLELENPRTGLPAVRQVVESRDAFRGEHLASLPDLVVQWDRSSPFHALRATWCGEIRGSYRGQRMGDHRGEGLLIAAAPGIPSESAGEGVSGTPISAMCLAPTLCAAFGIDASGFDDEAVRPFVAVLRRRAQATGRAAS